jgi:hypothetical protein
MNKAIASLIILLISSPSFAEGIPNVNIDCSDSTCTPDFTVNDNAQRNTYNAIDVGANSSNIIIKTGANKNPRNLKMNVSNGEFPDGTTVPGYSVNANLSSSTQTSDAASFVLVGDNFKDISVKLNGYNGKAGKSASNLCADNIKSDLYGTDSNDFFSSLRLNDPQISENSCQIDDLNFLQTNKFQCDPGFSEVITTNSVYSVNIQRIPRYNRCQTGITYNMCIKRMVQVGCTWDIFDTVAGLKKPFSITIQGVMPENRYYFLRNTMTDMQVCENYVARDISNPDYVAPTSPGGENPYKTSADDKGGCVSTNPANPTCVWKISPTVGVGLTSPGLIASTGELHPDSLWRIIQKAPGESCDTSTILNPLGDAGDGGFWSNYKTVTVNFIAYDTTSTQCSPANLFNFSGGNKVPTYQTQAAACDDSSRNQLYCLDPNKRATWYYTGQTQEPDFGTEVVQCELGNCPVTNIVSDLTQSLDTITPQAGEDGTSQGGGYVLIYDAETINLENKVGIAGAGGRSDLPNTSTTRVCSKIKDAQSEGLFSDYSRNPSVSFNRYNWTAIKTNASGNPGTQPLSSGNQIVLWKKLDTSSREVLRDILFNK